MLHVLQHGLSCLFLVRLHSCQLTHSPASLDEIVENWSALKPRQAGRCRLSDGCEFALQICWEVEDAMMQVLGDNETL